MGAHFSRAARSDRPGARIAAGQRDPSLPEDPDHSVLPPINRETTPLSQKQDALEMMFMLESMRMKQWMAEDSNRRACLERIDNSEHADEYDPATFAPTSLPLDDEGFVQSFDVTEGDAIRAFFATHGLVVVRDVIDSDACARSLDQRDQQRLVGIAAGRDCDARSGR